MRFLFLSLGYHPDLIGGAYRYATELAARLAARGHDVEAVVPNPEAKFPTREERDGVTIHRYPDEKGGGWRSWRAENRSARRILADRMRSDTLLGFHHGYYAPCLEGWGARSVALFHGPWGLEYAFARQAAARTWFRRGRDRLVAWRLTATERRLLRGVRRIFVDSRYVAGRLPGWHGAGLPPVEVIYGGVDVEAFRPLPDRASFRRARGLAEGDFLFVTVRRLDPRMGLLTLIEAFAQVARDYPHARLWLAGQGPQRPELEARLRTLGLAQQARLAGFVAEAELPGFLSAADCALMPSLDLEGFGLATVEALACGTPVLGSRAGATPELLAPWGERVLFEPGSVEALAARLRAVLAQPSLLPGAEACRSHVLREFGWDRPVAAVERAWQQLVSGT